MADLEFPLTGLPIYAARPIFEVQDGGFIPSWPIQRAPNQLYNLVEWGCWRKITSGSLTGIFRPRVQAMTRTLVEHNDTG